MSGQIRRVALVHHPINLGRASSQSKGKKGGWPNPLSDQWLNHWAVQVGEGAKVVRYALDRNKAGGVDLKFENEEDAQDDDDYEVASFPIFNTTYTGLTSYSNQEIKSIADDFIKQHGEYKIFTSNCQQYAKELFNAIANEKGSVGAKVSEVLGAITREIAR